MSGGGDVQVAHHLRTRLPPTLLDILHFVTDAPPLAPAQARVHVTPK